MSNQLAGFSTGREQQNLTVFDLTIKDSILSDEPDTGGFIPAGDLMHALLADYREPGRQQMVQRFLRLAQPPAQHYGNRALLQPLVDDPNRGGDGLFLWREYVIWPAVGAFDDQGIARDSLGGFVDGRGLGSQIAGVQDALAGGADGHEGLRGTETMAGRVQGDGVVRGFQRLTVLEFDGLGTAQVFAQQDAGAGGQDGTIVARNVVGMGVGNYRCLALAQ